MRFFARRVLSSVFEGSVWLHKRRFLKQKLERFIFRPHCMFQGLLKSLCGNSLNKRQKITFPWFSKIVVAIAFVYWLVSAISCAETQRKRLYPIFYYYIHPSAHRLDLYIRHRSADRNNTLAALNAIDKFHVLVTDVRRQNDHLMTKLKINQASIGVLSCPHLYKATAECPFGSSLVTLNSSGFS